MPRIRDPKTSGASGMGEGWAVVIDLLTAIAVWTGIGFGLDHAFGTAPVLMACGMVLGATAGIYVLYRRASQAPGRTTPGAMKPGEGVTRRGRDPWPAIGDAGAVARDEEDRGER